MSNVIAIGQLISELCPFAFFFHREILSVQRLILVLVCPLSLKLCVYICVDRRMVQIKCCCNPPTNGGVMALCFFQVVIKRNYVCPMTYLCTGWSAFFRTVCVYMYGKEKDELRMSWKYAN